MQKGLANASPFLLAIKPFHEEKYGEAGPVRNSSGALFLRVKTSDVSAEFGI
jgi:hypothetical protein